MSRYDSLYKERSESTHSLVHLPYVSDPNNSVQVVLIGDSHIERLAWFGALKKQVPPHVFVAGVGGDKVQNINYRLLGSNGLLTHLASRKQTKRIIYMAGGNNGLQDENSVKRTSATIAYTLQQIQELMPGVDIVVLMIPRASKAYQKKPVLYEEFSQQLAAVCANPNLTRPCTYSRELYDLTCKFDDKQIFNDEVHLNEYGYVQCVLPVMQKYWLL